MGLDETGGLFLAEVYLDAGRARDALKIAVAHLAIHSDDARALLIATEALVAEQDYEEALIFARHGSRVEPDNAEVWRVLSRVLSRMERFDDARVCALTSRRLAPMSWSSHAAVAEVDVSENFLTSAGRAAARSAVRLAPDEPDAHLVLGNTLRVACCSLYS